MDEMKKRLHTDDEGKILDLFLWNTSYRKWWKPPKCRRHFPTNWGKILYYVKAYGIKNFTFFIVEWLDLDKTLREQGIDDSHSLLLKRKFFYSDQNVDIKDPVQLNLLYMQVSCHNLFAFFILIVVIWFIKYVIVKFEFDLIV